MMITLAEAKAHLRVDGDDEDAAITAAILGAEAVTARVTHDRGGIVGALLRADADLTATVPVASIKAGSLPDGVALPALIVRLVSSVDRQPLKRGATVHVTDRVAVAVRARSYREQVAVIALVRRCCAGWRGDLAGASRASILTAGLGPDLAGPASSFEQTQDFRVSFDTPSRIDRLKADGITPRMPPCDAPFIIYHLIEIGLTEAAGMGAVPVAWQTIEAWQRSTQIDLPIWEARLIRQLSTAYLAESRKAEDENRPPPWRGVGTEQDRSGEEARLRAVLG